MMQKVKYRPTPAPSHPMLVFLSYFYHKKVKDVTLSYNDPFGGLPVLLEVKSTKFKF